MTDFDLLLSSLSTLHSPAWINQYFDLVKKLLNDLGLENDDPRLALSLPKDGRLPVNIGQRYVLLPLRNEYLCCIVPADFSPEAVDGHTIGIFSPNSTRDAKWIEIHFPLGAQFPKALYNACLEECNDILNRTSRSGFRKHHKKLVYDFTMEPAVRNELLGELHISGRDGNQPTSSASQPRQETNAVLLVWNPKKWEWKDLEEKVERVRSDGKVTMNWSCGHTQSIKPGDRVFLMRLGPVTDKGLVASGYVRSRPFLDRHYNEKGQQAMYVIVDFDVLINPEHDPILPLESLKVGKLGSQLWTPQNSGIFIRQELISELEALWFNHIQNGKFRFNPLGEPEDLVREDLMEGGSYQVTQTRYERNPEARRRCLDHYGYACEVCSFDFEKIYGALGKEFIHVHHLHQIAYAGGQYKIDPVKDLRPVCPNCHAMLHRSKMPLTIEELKKTIIKCSNEGNLK